MKKLLTFFMVLGYGIITGQIIDIPDLNFREALVNTNCVDSNNDNIGDRDVDVNDDNLISIEEVSNIKWLNISEKEIDSLNGLEYFTNLTALFCANNKIVHFHDYKLKNLTYLNLFSNNIETIDLSNLVSLNHVVLNDNKLISINTTFSLKLEQLFVENNQISQMNLVKNIQLRLLYCSNNLIESIDLDSLPALSELFISTNKLQVLHLTNNHKLRRLSCGNNQISTLLMKTGSGQLFGPNEIFLGNNPLKYICCDDDLIGRINEELLISNLNNVVVNSYCSFTPGGKFYSIFGETKFDTNMNGCDDNDINFSYLKYRISDGTATGSLVANETGKFFIAVQEGNHTIIPSTENSQYFSISPPSITATFPSNSDTLIQNFCITPIQFLRQIDITVLPLIPPARPGFAAQYKVVITNKGNQIENGKLNLVYEEAILDYVNSDKDPTSRGDGFLSWDFKDLIPFETRTYTVTLKVNTPIDIPAVNAGDVLQISASILDNIFILNNTVVGSYDPNDKTCLEGDKISPDKVNDYIHYLIRFENTGTYAAENVVVKDTIDEDVFDVSSLEITNASHQVITKIRKNVIEFIFEKIDLPFDDTNNDGYIAFKIKTKPSLKPGEQLKNKANIYFDYNFPIETNEATSVIANIVGTNNPDLSSMAFIYPNPTGDYINISNPENIFKVEIYDLSGKIIQTSRVLSHHVEVKSLKNGTYFLKMYKKEGFQVSKLVKN